MEIVVVFLILTFLLLLTGFPVAFILSGVSLLFALIGVLFDFFDYSFLMAFPNRLFGVMGNQNLLAVPLFIFMGLILEKTKIAESLITDMNNLFNNTDSGLAISVVLVGALLAASTGIVGASVVTLGLLTYPVLVKNGYSASIASGTICAAGTLGQIIPPSLVLILLADVLSSSYQQAQLNMGIYSPETITIADLFVGAILPGLILPILYVIYLKTLKIKTMDKKREKINLVSIIYPLGLMFIVLGSIILGVATPSEAAGLGALGAILIAYTRNNLSKSVLDQCVVDSIKLTSMVFMILIGAILFSLVFRGLEGEEFIHKFLIEMPDDKLLTLIIVLFIMFALGFILDFIEITFIVIPLVGPALFTLGYDPLWIGILIALVLQTSFITPPFGFSLFYLRGVLPSSVDTKEIYKGIIPFLVIQIILMAGVFIFPELATYLPKLLLK
ncbi:MAG: TRAP transporter large permease subunit [Pseudomonadota bacterium]|nr:TRAP transporter large permease subunit [Pseudomonadota bacterium]